MRERSYISSSSREARLKRTHRLVPPAAAAALSPAAGVRAGVRAVVRAGAEYRAEG